MLKGQKKKSSHVIVATLCFSYKRCGISHILNNNIMIFLNSKNFNITSQLSYNSLLKSFNVYSTAVLIAAVVLLFSMEHILEVYVVRMESSNYTFIEFFVLIVIRHMPCFLQVWSLINQSLFSFNVKS